MSESKYVVRNPGGHYCETFNGRLALGVTKQRDAYKHPSRSSADQTRQVYGGKVYRLVSRAEAVAKARRQGIVEGLIRGAVSLESSAKSQDMAAWESAQRSGMDDFVKAHEATAKAYRAGAESLREQAKWAGEKQ